MIHIIVLLLAENGLHPVEQVFVEEVEIKAEECYEPFVDDSGELDALFQEEEIVASEVGARSHDHQEIIVDEDISIVIIGNVFPTPIQTTFGDLKKHSGDWFSGDLPFNILVSKWN